MAEYVKCALISNNDKVESGGDDKQRNERERERERLRGRESAVLLTGSE